LESIFNDQLMMNFRSLNPSVLLTQAQQVIASMTGNANFPEPYTAPAPSLAQLTTDLNNLQSAVTAVSVRDLSRIQERDAAFATLATDMLRLTRYVELVSDEDLVKLQSSGFMLRARAPRRTVFDTLPAPSQLMLTKGGLSGQIMVKASRLSGAGSYEVQLAAADPTTEASWNPAGTFKNCSRILLQGLTPGKTYSVRLRGIGTGGPGTWSSAASLMVT
jgi:hypothetical protein